MGGAIMGEFMDKSGAAKAIAQAIMAKVQARAAARVGFVARTTSASPTPCRCAWRA